MGGIFNMNNMQNEYIKIQRAWLQAAQDLEIQIRAPFFIKKNGKTYSYLLLIQNFGNTKGTLIENINDMNLKEDILNKEGYHLSFLNPIHYKKYNRQLFIDTLNDWRWFGSIDKKPKWCK